MIMQDSKKKLRVLVHEPGLKSLVIKLLKTYEEHHGGQYPSGDRLRPTDYFSEEDAWRVSGQIDSIQGSQDILNILDCDILKGGVNRLFESLVEWRNGSAGQRRLEDMMEQEIELSKAAEETRELARSKEEEEKKTYRRDWAEEAGADGEDPIDTGAEEEKGRWESRGEKESKGGG